jgi:dTDP-4-dehydrorhamnose 3,5-epimerase
METYKKSEFVENGIDVEFSQDNHSKSGASVLKGLHYQKKPYEQAKLVRCLQGEIYDVAVDIRKKSKTFGKRICFEPVLSDKDKNWKELCI